MPQDELKEAGNRAKAIGNRADKCKDGNVPTMAIEGQTQKSRDQRSRNSRVLSQLPWFFRLAKWWEKHGLRGRHRLWRLTCRLCGRNREYITTLHYGAKVCLPLSDPMSRYPIVYGGMPEPILYKTISNALSPGDVFVDVGANFGYYTLLSALIVGPEGHVYAFEPQPQVAEELKRNVALNRYQNVSVHSAAVGQRCGEETLHIPRWYQSGLATLQPKADWMKGIEVRRMTVPVTTLDEMFSGQDFAVRVLKIDAEGYGLPILQGGERLLSGAAPPLIFCETEQDNIAEIVETMRIYGYTAFKLGLHGLVKIDEKPSIAGQETICGMHPKFHEHYLRSVTDTLAS